MRSTIISHSMNFCLCSNFSYKEYSDPFSVDKTLRTEAPGDSTTDEVNHHQTKSLDDQYIGIIIGVLTAVIILLFAAMVIIIMRQRRRKYHNHQVSICVAKKTVATEPHPLF